MGRPGGVGGVGGVGGPGGVAGNRPSTLPAQGGRGQNGLSNWTHNPVHRGGTPYADRATAARFGGSARGDSLAQRQAGARQQIARQGGKLTSKPAAGGGLGNRAGNAGPGNRAGGVGSASRAGGAGPVRAAPMALAVVIFRAAVQVTGVRSEAVPGDSMDPTRGATAIAASPACDLAVQPRSWRLQSWRRRLSRWRLSWWWRLPRWWRFPAVVEDGRRGGGGRRR